MPTTVPTTEQVDVLDKPRKDTDHTQTSEPSQAQSDLTKETSVERVEEIIADKLEKHEDISPEEAAHVQSLEHKALGHLPPKGSLAAQAQSEAAKTHDTEQVAKEPAAELEANEPVVAEDAASQTTPDTEAKSLKHQPSTENVPSEAQPVMEKEEAQSDVDKKTTGPVEEDLAKLDIQDASKEKVDEVVSATDDNKDKVEGVAAPKQEASSASSLEQSHKDREANFQQAKLEVEEKEKHDPGSVTKEDASKLAHFEARAHGTIEKGGSAAHAQGLAAKNEKAPVVD